jgi:predicted Zn-dependent peptidase
VTTRSAGIRFEYETHVLDNGLQVILQPDRASPLVAVHVMYHVGSREEPPGRTGFAHLFEHLLFQGSAHVGEAEHFRLVQEAGGALNGSTWFDRTNYFETVPSNQLDLALWLEADRMGWFLPAITQAKLDNQRDVVKNERRQSYENRPYGLATETVLRHAFSEGHPYRHPTIGYMEDLDGATLDDVRAFFRTWYTPGNAVLVLAGDFDPAVALRRVDRYFGEIEPGPAPQRRTVTPPMISGETRAVITDAVTVPRTYMMAHAPAFPQPEYETSAVLATVLAGGRSARLYDDLVYEQRVAQDVHAFVWPLEAVGMLWVVATARPGVSAPALEAAIGETLARLAADGVTEAEVAGARNRARGQLVNSLSGLGGRADLLAHAAVLRGEPAYVNDVFGRYEKISRNHIDELACELLLPSRRTVVSVVPKE